MDKNGIFGEMLEKGQQAVTNSVKTVASDVAGQIGIKSEPSPDAPGQAQSQQTAGGSVQNQISEASAPQAASTDETIQFVKEFYAPSSELPDNLTPEVTQQLQQKDQMESQQKLANLRHELHKGEYYDPLIAHETKKSDEEEEDDGAAKRVEKQEQEEEQEKMQLEEKKAKDDEDIAKTRAQTKTEANRGAMG
jgi:hypothetical protein